jgi:hypothetical protein
MDGKDVISEIFLESKKTHLREVRNQMLQYFTADDNDAGEKMGIKPI